MGLLIILQIAWLEIQGWVLTLGLEMEVHEKPLTAINMPKRKTRLGRLAGGEFGEPGVGLEQPATKCGHCCWCLVEIVLQGGLTFFVDTVEYKARNPAPVSISIFPLFVHSWETGRVKGLAFVEGKDRNVEVVETRLVFEVFVAAVCVGARSDHDHTGMFQQSPLIVAISNHHNTSLGSLLQLGKKPRF
jgi:hypothetical protein